MHRQGGWGARSGLLVWVQWECYCCEGWGQRCLAPQIVLVVVVVFMVAVVFVLPTYTMIIDCDEVSIVARGNPDTLQIRQAPFSAAIKRHCSAVRQHGPTASANTYPKPKWHLMPAWYEHAYGRVVRKD